MVMDLANSGLYTQCVMTHNMVRHDAPSVHSPQWLWT